MKLAEWARQQGLDYKTAYRWFRAGILPVPSKQLPTGTILVEPVPLAEKRGAAVYARVSSGDQKNNLERHLARLVERRRGASGPACPFRLAVHRSGASSSRSGGSSRPRRCSQRLPTSGSATRRAIDGPEGCRR